MKKRLYLFGEILCVALLAGFMVFICIINTKGTEKTAEEISAPVISLLKDGQMSEKTAADAAEAFSFDISKAEGVIYYENENIMDVSELLIVKLKNESDADEFKRAVEKREEDRKNLYKNYAPDQYDILCKSVLEVSGNALFYCAAENSRDLYSSFKSSLR